MENKIEPVTPVTPAEPVTPTEPVTPVTPVEPTEPTTPTEPVTPAEPTTPAEPVTESIKYSEGAKFNGVDVEVEIPVDLINYGNEKGIDVEAMSKELYSSEDFSLSEDSLKQAYDAFGKWQVDTYLSGLKASNAVTINTAKADAERQTTEAKAAWDSTIEIMGGEDKWDDMSAYATEALSDAEFEEFNTVMQSGSLHMQQLMIKELYGKFAEAGAPVAPTVLKLEDGSPNGDPVETGTALSKAQFLEIMQSGKYKENPAKYDQLRRAGMAKGI